MCGGVILVRNKKGRTILCGNVWNLVLQKIFLSQWTVDPGEIQIFIDEKEIPQPASFNDAGRKGGDGRDGRTRPDRGRKA